MAPLVEQRLRNAQVPGSSPVFGSNYKAVIFLKVTAFFMNLSLVLAGLHASCKLRCKP